MKSEYREGPEAKENFEQAMKSLFQAPKLSSKKRKQKGFASHFGKAILRLLSLAEFRKDINLKLNPLSARLRTKIADKISL